MSLTPEERAKWDVDPDQWPHTPPFHVFRALMDEDDNLWWRAGSGHGLNAYDAAIERVEVLEAGLAALGFCPKDLESMPCTTCGAGL